MVTCGNYTESVSSLDLQSRCNSGLCWLVLGDSRSVSVIDDEDYRMRMINPLGNIRVIKQ